MGLATAILQAESNPNYGAKTGLKNRNAFKQVVTAKKRLKVVVLDLAANLKAYQRAQKAWWKWALCPKCLLLAPQKFLPSLRGMQLPKRLKPVVPAPRWTHEGGHVSHLMNENVTNEPVIPSPGKHAAAGIIVKIKREHTYLFSQE